MRIYIVNILLVLCWSLIWLTGHTACSPDPVAKPAEPPTPPQPADISAPRITDVSVTIGDNNSIKVLWLTDEDATGEIKLLDIVSDSGDQLYTDTKFARYHELTADGNLLKPGITYSITVISRDRAGNTASHFNARMLSVNTLALNNPAYRVFTLKGLNGEEVSLASFSGRQVLLHFWLPGCHVCEEELPLFDTIYTSSRQDELLILTICVRGDARQIADYVKSQGFHFPVLLDPDGTVGSAYNVGMFPSTYIVDAAGAIIRIKEGKFDSLYDARNFMGL